MMTETIPAISDSELLEEYLRDGSKRAFEKIVNRHIHLVHAAAARQVRDGHLAEDITQAVFLLLWQRAASIAAHGSLGGWLLVTTHHISGNAIKKEWRLKRREQKVAQMTVEENPSSPSQADSILPLLDSAMAQLSSADRDAIVERFFRSRSLDEVGAILGVSQRAAGMRITRAIEKLRGILTRRGVTTSDAMLIALLPVVALQPPASPSLLAAVLAGPSAAAPAGISSLVRSATQPWSALFVKLTAAILALMGLGGVAYLAVALQGTPPAPPAQQPVAPDNRTITLSLVDAKTKAPLGGGTVELDINPNNDGLNPAGPDGKCVLHLPETFDSARVMCRVPGRVTMYLQFQNYTFKGDLPPSFTIPMEPGVNIGGVVNNDLGDPLVGATVHISTITYAGNSDIPRMCLDENVITDAKGEWHVNGAPQKLDQLELQIKHPAFPQPMRMLYVAGAIDPPMDQLRRGTFEIVMKSEPGSRIDGVVLDPDGKAVPRAQVVIGNDRYQAKRPTALTDADGKFTLTSPVINVLITATAKGFAPGQATIPPTGADGKPDPKPIEIRLSPAMTLEGTVVDGNGRPVTGATVEVEQWRGNGALKWSTKTDRNGRFVWNSAPAETLQLHLYRKDLASLTGVTAKAGGEPLALTMFPTLKITGDVIDADTRQPIAAFRIFEGVRWGTHEDVTWQPDSARQLGGGKFEATISDFATGGKLRVEANGYLPSTSRLILGNGGSIQIDFELKKGSGPGGIVLDDRGNPLPDATVICVPLGMTIPHVGGRTFASNSVEIATVQTDKNGHFSLQPRDGKFSLVVNADEGFAMIDGDQFARDGRIHLQKWVSFEGDFRINAGPAKRVKIAIEPLLQDASNFISALPIQVGSTDGEGHFVFNAVPPGVNVRIYSLVPVSESGTRYVPLGTYKAPTPGQTATVHLGGKGRPVIGKISLPQGIAGPVDYTQQIQFISCPADDVDPAVLRRLPYVVNYPDLPREAQYQWVQSHLKKDLTPSAQPGSHLPLDFVVKPDGAFRAENVEPGTYQLLVDFFEPLEQNANHRESLGSATVVVTVPSTPACPSNEALDIGTVRLTAQSKIEIGKPLPPVQLVTLDGKTVDRSVWSGKIVVLHLWEMHDRTFFPAIRQVAEKFKDDPRVQIVNVGMEMLPAWATHIDATDHLPGLLVLEKDSSELNTQETYTKHSWMEQDLPYLLILDAQGNVAAKVSEPGGLASAINKATEK